MNDDQKAQLLQLEAAVKSLMTKEAVQRFTNIRLAHPMKAIQAMALIAQFVQQGKIAKVDDELLKNILLQLEQKKETKIHFR